MKKVFQILSVAVIVLTAASCGEYQTTTYGLTVRPVDKPDANTESAMPADKDFSEFFKKFVADKNFQLAHIKFPMKSGMTPELWRERDWGWQTVNWEDCFFERKSDSEYRYIGSERGEYQNLFATFRKIKKKWYMTDFEGIKEKIYD
jgi:predicted small lipoprotein YifL